MIKVNKTLKGSDKLNCIKLKLKVFEKFANQTECAQKLDISRAFLNEVLNGKKNFRYETILKVIEVLDLTEQEALDIFFPDLVAKSKQ